jgi:serine/threonine protein kinase/WD40 repeat protein
MQALPLLHPSDRDLCAFANGELDSAKSAVISTHLDDCHECLQKVAGISSDGFLDAFRNARLSESSAPGETDRGDCLYRDAIRPFLGNTGAAGGFSAAGIPPGLADDPDYEVRRELGRGGMGVVYLAYNRLVARDEVLKVMGQNIIERPGVTDRFLREIRTVARFRHPNIVAAYTAFRRAESLVFAMEYVEGLDLASLVNARGPIPVEEACCYVQQAALGLQHAHEWGTVHRDIKPSNIMLSQRGEQLIKILDFGLAKANREYQVPKMGIDGAEKTQQTAADLTILGQPLGTPAYIAPEQINNALHADIRADIYSLGCTLYYLLSGGPPFPAETVYDMLQAHHSMDAQPLNIANPEVPSELEALVAKMMTKEPERRFQTPGEVARGLQPFIKTDAPKAVAVDFQASPPDEPAVSPRSGGSRELAVHSSTASIPTPGGVPWPDRHVEIKESQIDFDERPAIRPPPAKSPEPARGRPSRPWSLGAGLLGLVTILLGAGVTYRIVTDRGQLVIETDDPSIEVVVKQSGELVTIIDPQTKKQIELRSGQYDLELTGGKPGLRLSAREITLKRGDQAIVTMRSEPEPPDKLDSASELSPTGLQPELVEVAPLRGHADGVESVAVSPDGRRVLSGSSDRTMVLWDIKSRAEVQRFAGHGGWVMSVAFSPDGRQALSGGEDKVIRLWDLETGGLIREFKGHPDWVIRVAFSPDGRRVYSTSGGFHDSDWRKGTDFAVRVWDVETGRQIGKMEGHRGVVWGLSVSPDGRKLLTGGDTIIVWDAETRAEIRRFSEHEAEVANVAFLPDGRRAASSGWDGTIRLWDLGSGQQLRCFRGNSRGGTCVAVSPDGRCMLSSNWGGRDVRLWDVESGKQLYQVGWGSVHPLQGCFTPDGLHAVWTGSDAVIRIYRINKAAQEQRSASPNAPDTSKPPSLAR